jgi:hypothetical protein
MLINYELQERDIINKQKKTKEKNRPTVRKRSLGTRAGQIAFAVGFLVYVFIIFTGLRNICIPSMKKCKSLDYFTIFY